MADFTTAVDKLLKWEGGKVNDPVDPGGKTNFGITQKTMDGFQARWISSTLPKDVFDLTSEQASDFYFFEFWIPCRGRMVASQPLASLLLSMAVLQGKKPAVRRLQALVGVPADGLMGDKSLSAIGEADPKALLKSYANANLHFFDSLIAKRPASEKYRKGWTARVEDYLA